MEFKLLSDPGGWCGDDGHGEDNELDGHTGNELVEDHWLGEGKELGLLVVSVRVDTSRVLPKTLELSCDSRDPIAGLGQDGAAKVLPVQVVAMEPKAFPSPHPLGQGMALLGVVPGIIFEAETGACKLSWLRCPASVCDATGGQVLG